MTGESKGVEGEKGHILGPHTRALEGGRWEDASQDDPPLQGHEADEVEKSAPGGERVSQTQAGRGADGLSGRPQRVT